MAKTYCSEIVSNWCENRKPKIDSACHDLGKEAGKWIMYDVNDKACYCICSCLGVGTTITLADESTEPVEDLVQGETRILAAGLDLNFQAYVAGQVSHAAPGKTDNTIYLTFGGRMGEMVVTMDHPFLVREDGVLKLVAASSLSPRDELLDRDGNAVVIDEISWGSYDGAFWELATSMTRPDEQYTGHLVLTDGIVTGDFAVTTFVDFAAGLGRMSKHDPNRPAVGSRAWMEKYGVTLSEELKDVKGHTFRPAPAHRVRVPEHASVFLPSIQSAILEKRAPKVGIENQYYLEECEWLRRKVFEPLYPDVTFLFDWYDEEVNSHSWVDEGQKYVYLSGGLARIEGFEYEGVALALAHEMGHLLGEPEVAPGVTCEGEADFYGAHIVLRRIWFGEFYFEFTKAAVAQVELLYGYLKPKDDDEPAEGTDSDAVTDKFGQPYPSNACRLRTFRAAMQGPDKPACAECRAPGGVEATR